jgi:hypothetical protein
MSYITKVSEKVWNTYINGYSEVLMTPVELFDKSFDPKSKKILANVLRELANQLQYNPNLPEDDMIINAWDVYEIANELEKQK